MYDLFQYIKKNNIKYKDIDDNDDAYGYFDFGGKDGKGIPIYLEELDGDYAMGVMTDRQRYIVKFLCSM